MEICTFCNKEFKNKYSLANHLRYGCYTLREYKLCNNENCNNTYKYSKSGLCQSCSAKQSTSKLHRKRTGKTYEELYGIESIKIKNKISVGNIKELRNMINEELTEINGTTNLLKSRLEINPKTENTWKVIDSK